jgi:hypothetical protein
MLETLSDPSAPGALETSMVGFTDGSSAPRLLSHDNRPPVEAPTEPRARRPGASRRHTPAHAESRAGLTPTTPGSAIGTLSLKSVCALTCLTAIRGGTYC